MVRRTKEEAQATRETIIDAAEKVFYEKGVAHASLEEIAQAAGCTRGAIYWHFKDKAELFDAMMCRVMLPAEAMLERAKQAGATDPLSILRLSTIEVLQRTARDAHLQRVFDIAYHKCEYVGDATGVRERHIASQQECLGSIEAGFHDCIEQGFLPRSVNAKEAAIGAMSLVSGLIANWVLDPKSFALARHAESLVDVYFRGLQSTPAAAQAPRPKAAPRARLKAVK